jgi:hypothetical protein
MTCLSCSTMTRCSARPAPITCSGESSGAIQVRTEPDAVVLSYRVRSPTSRRVEIRLGELFACRNCYQLVYESQQEDPFIRSLKRSQKIRMRLGGSGDPFGPLPEKPRGCGVALARVERSLDFPAR